ncbi:hypothetical protein [Cytobacillus purgationiresistens]|uniref:Uncharacterized protein n=1 Tax=Cytobacillus purgationiresistens TaxID=863449 RepID=A0ABU0AGY1_9BACI|nr:hypothetical protein [Cytobacillus purgationiresistens]MDQ0269976.1 hypothetical protein [Cytobacillus purgationiresistens]
MSIHSALINSVVDGDFHTVADSIEYSTNIREIVTIGYMMENYIEED